MPRTLSSNEKYRTLGILLNGAAKSEKKDLDEVARIIGLSRRSAYKYLKFPEKLSTEKLLKLGRNLNIPIDELRESLRY